MTSSVATYIGFDSAWTDSVRAPGAICAVRIGGSTPAQFHAPQLVRFGEALAFIDAVTAGSSYVLIGLDQPTIVPNMSGMRPAERVAASVISWMGGGVQPAHRSRTGMFCDGSPIWPFLDHLGATEDPMAARTAASGVYLMEVFPALALASLDPDFCRRFGAPRYNPANARHFDARHWTQVCTAAAGGFDRWGLPLPAAWCRAAAMQTAPRKADQDRLDAMLCLGIALHWRQAPPEQSIMIGDLASGYIVSPACVTVRRRLIDAARKRRVAIDGSIPDAAA